MKVERETIFTEYGPSSVGYGNRVTGEPVQAPEFDPSTADGLSVLREMLVELARGGMRTGTRLRVTVETLED